MGRNKPSGEETVWIWIICVQRQLETTAFQQDAIHVAASERDYGQLKPAQKAKEGADESARPNYKSGGFIGVAAI